MQSIAIVADTHIPSRASAIPTWVETAMRRADVVVHAGDFDSDEAFERVESIASELIAVRGNTDPPLGLPEVTTLEVEGATFLITHNAGPLRGYRDRLRTLVSDHDGVDLVVAAHSHEATDERLDGHRFVNPGSATGAPPATEASIAEATVDGDHVTVELRTA
ncbi:MAG: metallophosphoesterase family protein [Halobacteriota archaeon]